MKKSIFPELKTERLQLDRIETADQQQIYLGLSHPEVIRYYGVSYSNFKETEEQMDWYENLENSGSGRWWAIRLKESKRFCGVVGFYHLMEEHKKAEIGFWLLPEFWGKGIIPEAAVEMINYLFTKNDIHRLEAYVETGNSNSAKVLKKLGFEFEGCLKDSEIKNGKFIDLEIYARINSK